MAKIPGMNLLMLLAAFAFGAVAMFFYADMQDQAKVAEEKAVQANASPIPQRADFFNSDSPPPERSKVARVFDGLTVGLESGHVVRYLGVRVPGVGDPVQCFGKEALQANESMMGKEIRLEKDEVLDQAQDGAWVRYVWVKEEDGAHESLPSVVTQGPDGEFTEGGATEAGPAASPSPTATAKPTKQPNDASGEGQEADGDKSLSAEATGDKEYLVNERIMELGLGFPLLSEEMTHFEKILAAARFSSATRRGLWKVCEVKPDEKEFLQTQATTECVVKGVKLVDGRQVYREPGCKGYSETVVLTQSGEKWFCSPEEASNAGFVRAEDCQ